MFRKPVKEKEQRAKTLVFTAEQEHAIECFWQEYSRDVRAAYLLYGVTGSGKTEVYIEMIRRVVSEGKQAIVLIPEIALTYQTVMRFYRRFGNRVSILNSRMSAGERYDQLMRAKAGEIDVMIGPRSALFTPFPELGLIVIDEEHETTYKSEQIPRYHARETAIERANLEHASVVLGSATPSLEAMYRSKNGEYRLLELKNRSGMQKMASVYVADLRQELKEGNRSILSRHLQELMEDRLEKQEQIMLFLNRRGYAGFLSCRECGHVVKCPHCDVSLSYHRNGKMVCHYCGYEEPRTPVCPECGSRHIGEFRAGTQQIEDIVKAQFPQARVLRMDMDTTRQKELCGETSGKSLQIPNIMDYAQTTFKYKVNDGTILYASNVDVIFGYIEGSDKYKGIFTETTYTYNSEWWDTFLEGMPNVLTGEVSVDDYCKQVAPKMQEALDNAIELQNAATNN